MKDKQEFRKQAFENNMQALFTAITSSLESKLQLPALILIYSTIDILGAIDSADGMASKENFLQWTGKYLLSGSKLQCQAIDLYGARCGLLHTCNPESNLSRKGMAIPICYSWGCRTAEELQILVNKISATPIAVAIKIEDLSSSLKKGFDRFNDLLSRGGKRARKVYVRAGKFLEPIRLPKTNVP